MRGLLVALVVVLSGCADPELETSRDYRSGYDDAWEEASEQITALESEKAEMARAIDDAQAAIANAQVSATGVESAIDVARRETDRFSYDDWEYVVSDVTSAVRNAETSASSVASDLSDAELALITY